MYRKLTAGLRATAPRGRGLHFATRRRRGRTRIWDEMLAPREPMNPNEPTDLLEAIIAHFLHPVRSMRAQIARGGGWEESPWKLWGVLAFIAVVGSLIYGATIALVLPAGGWGYAAFALAASAGAGWILFGSVLLGITRNPAPLVAHACMVTMMFGEAVLELGVLANVAMGWLLGTPAGTALAVNIGVVGLANVAMLAVLAAQLRQLHVSPALTAALWFGILNPAGLAAFRLFYPELFPF